MLAQVHVDEKSPEMYQELMQWVEREALDYAVQVYSQHPG